MQTFEQVLSNWQHLEAVDRASLRGAQDDLHHLIQFPAGANISFRKPADDDSHTNLKWSRQHRAFRSKSIGDDDVFKVAARFDVPGLLVIDADRAVVAEKAAAGNTMDDLQSWLSQSLFELGLNVGRFTMEKHYSIPTSELDDDQPFQLEHTKAYIEFSRLYGNADLVLKWLRKSWEDASKVRCWPHHFDIATLIPATETDGAFQSIGVGMAPADMMVDEPYFYVSPNPLSDASNLSTDALPEFENLGTWHGDEHWFGAILPYSQLAKVQGAGNQAEATGRFLKQATEALHSA